MTFQDYRTIPLEVLRDFALSRSHATSIRVAAAEVGIGRSTFNKFTLGRTQPQPRVRRLLALWYLERHNEAHDIDVARPYVAALSILLSEVPVPEQEAAHAEAIAAFRSIYEPRAPLPRWLELLLNLSGPGR